MAENDIVKEVDKIPFTKKEIESEVSEIILSELNSMSKSLMDSIENTGSVGDISFYKKNDGTYLIFLSNQTEKSKNDFKNAKPNGILNEKLTQDSVERIYNVYHHKMSQKKSFVFVANPQGETVFVLNDGEWEEKVWEDGLKAFPVFTCSLPDSEKSPNDLFLSLIKKKIHIKSIFDDSEIDLYERILNVPDCITVSNGKFEITDFEILEKNGINDYLERAYISLLNQMGIENPSSADEIKNYLLECDTRRCDLERYSESYITGTDANAGLWDFWSDGNTPYGYPLPAGMKVIERNPKYDIVEGGSVAIDFGTSSTVVVIRDGEGKVHQMNIGKGDSFENPTLLKVFSLENFMKFYKAKSGRPYTSWSDMWASHAVNEIFSSEHGLDEGEVSSILYQIKQWAADDKMNTVLKPINDDKITTLKSLSEIVGTDDFNPIEIYAYFIGLYINNRKMGHGIYLNYYMTYPAKFDKNTKENIQKSFEKGLRKSIPESVFEDEKYELKVEMTASEPEAYAACALQIFGFMPKADKPVNYAIFDFGGGTADFAYGEWKKPPENEQEIYDFVINNIATDGNRYLGGENILSGLAFNVFADENNLKELAANDCRFNYGVPEQKGSCIPERYLSNQQTAKKNMKSMAEALRTYWENASEHFSEFLNSKKENYSMSDLEKLIGEIMHQEVPQGTKEKLVKIRNDVNNGNDTIEGACAKIKTFQKNNDDVIFQSEEDSDEINFQLTLASESISEGETKHNTPNVKFTYSKRKIYEYFVSEIQKGVDSFFTKLEKVFFQSKSADATEKKRINIFLAGNSSKSPILRKLIEEKILLESAAIKTKYRIEPEFKLFSPLGKNETYDEMRELLAEQGTSEEGIERKLNHEKSKKQKPTGKTGVAFGLIDFIGGKINIENKNSTEKQIDEFLFYLGREVTDDIGIKVFRCIDLKDGKDKPELGKWYSALKVAPTKTRYILRYTDNPACLTGDFEADKTKMKEFPFSHTDEGQAIWIRAANSKTIEYVLAKDETEANNKAKDNPEMCGKVTLE